MALKKQGGGAPHFEKCFEWSQRYGSISTATNGIAALEKARTELPWIIILDLMLPKMTDAELCRILKADRVTRNIPIIILTAKAIASPDWSRTASFPSLMRD